MEHFEGKVAVITGAARGIGRGLAERCVAEGMKVILVDTDRETLTQFQKDIETQGGEALAVPTDVSSYNEVETLAQKTLDRFGAVHLLINNAGLGGVGDALKPIWECPLTDWEQTLAVNLWGVIYGIRVFVPLMLQQNEECYVVNVASVAGLVTGSKGTAYKVSKHGVVALSECLYKGLAEQKANIKVTVICPGSVGTNIVERAIDRWSRSTGQSLDDLNPEEKEYLLNFDEGVKQGMPPSELAELLFKALRENRFYVLSHPKIKEKLRTRMEDILDERNPTE